MHVICGSFLLHPQKTDIKFSHVTMEQGLSQGSVLSIAQDAQGFIWLATQDGLNRYDGYNFKIFKFDLNKSQSISDSYVKAVYVDQAGVLWCGGFNGLNRFDQLHETFSRYEHNKENDSSLSSDRILTIYESSPDAFWVGTDNGLNQFDRKNGKVSRKFLSGKYISAIIRESPDRLWIGTRSGLVLLNIKTGDIFTYDRSNGLTDDYVTALYLDADDNLWIGTNAGGLSVFDKTKQRFIHYNNDPYNPKSLSHNSITCIAKDNEGQLWIGTDGGGLNRWNPLTENFIHTINDRGNPFGINSNRITSLYSDKSGVLWVGTYNGGINKIEIDKGFKTYNSFNYHSFACEVVWSIYKDQKGYLWIGTDEGLFRLDRHSQSAEHFKHSSLESSSIVSNRIFVAKEDRHGKIWIGTDNGLDLMDVSSKKFRHYPSHNPANISSRNIRSILIDSKDNLWLSTFDGIAILDSNRTTYQVYRNNPNDPKTLASDEVRQIYEDRSGTYWIATNNGLDRLNHGSNEFIHYRHDAQNLTSISHNRIRNIFEDQAGILWIGTANGLNKFDRQTEKFKRFFIEDGLPNEIILGIVDDSQGNLWLSTNNGLVQFNREHETFRNYDKSDGLQSNEFTTMAYFKGHDGEIFFGGLNGFMSFFPDSLKDNHYVPPIVLTAFKKFNREYDLAIATSMIDEIHLNYDDYVFSFEFASLNYNRTHKNQYAYKMENFDSDWNYIGGKHDVTYTNLDPGEYIFHVKGSNNEGIWNERGKSILIHIAPPFWKTWWFMGLAIIVSVGGIFGAISYRIHRLLEVERLRIKIAADLHDSVGTGLTELSILSEVGALQHYARPEAAREWFNKIGDTARQLGQNISDIVWLVNPRYDSLSDVLLQLKKSYDEIFFHKDIVLKCPSVSEWSHFSLSLEQRRHLYFVLKEAINNGLKHSQCRTMNLSVEGSHRKLQIRYEDDGIGFDPNQKSDGEGIPNIVQRVRLMNGQVTIDSTAGKGTRITLLLPNA